MTDLTEPLADHAANFPASEVTAAIGGSRTAGVRETLQFLADEAAPGVSQVFGDPRRLSALAATQANATAAHALDFDNTPDEGVGRNR